MKRVSKFQQSSIFGKSTYHCDVCGKLTRETGDGESGCNLCRACYWEAGYDNAIMDGKFICKCGNTKDFTLDGKKEVCTCNVCGAKGLYEKWK